MLINCSQLFFKHSHSSKIHLLFIIIVFYITGCSSRGLLVSPTDEVTSPLEELYQQEDFEKIFKINEDQDISQMDCRSIEITALSYYKNGMYKKALDVYDIFSSQCTYSPANEYEINLIKADIYAQLRDWNKSDSIYNRLRNFVPAHFSDTTKELGRLFLSHGKMLYSADMLEKSEEMLIKSLVYNAEVGENLTYLARGYATLSKIFFFKENMVYSISYFYRAIETFMITQDYLEALDLIYDKMIFYTSKSLSFSRFTPVFEAIEEFEPSFSQSEYVYYKTLYAKYIDKSNAEPLDNVYEIYRELDSLYQHDRSIFSSHASIYFEVFFPLLNKLGKIDQSRQLMELIGTDFELETDTLLVSETVNMAFWAYNTGQYGLSQRLFNQALREYQQKYGNNSPVTAELMDKIGVMYLSSGLTIEAMSFFDRSMSIKKETIPDNRLDMGISYNNIAEAHRIDGFYDKSVELYHKAKEEFNAIEDESRDEWLCKVYHNLGVLYTDSKDYDSSEYYLAKAIEKRIDLFGETSVELIMTYIAAGKLFQENEMFTESMRYYDKALTIIKVNGLYNTNFELSYRIGRGILYTYAGNYNKAYEYLSFAEKYLEQMGDWQSERLRDVRKFLFIVAREQEDVEEIERLREVMYGH